MLQEDQIMRVALGMVLVCFLGGCYAAPPTVHRVEGSARFPAPPGEVYRAAKEALNARGWGIREADPEAMMLVSEWIRDDLGGGDYGSGSMGASIVEDSREVEITITASDRSGGGTYLRVSCYFRARWSIHGTEQMGRGTSRGTIERLIIEEVGARL